MSRLQTLIAALVLAACAPQAHAVFRAYVSSKGSDANPCSVAAPCRLLPAALAVADAGGEVWMLDSANYNTAPVIVSKPVSILAVPGAVGSIVATGGGVGLRVQTGSGDVSLRNLVVVHLGSSSHGIEFASGTRLDIADCEVANVGGSGIYAGAAGGRLSVRNCDIHGVAGYGIFVVGDVRTSIERTQLRANRGSALGTFDSVNVTVTGSTLANNQRGIVVTGGNPARLVVDDTVITGNAVEGVLLTGSPVMRAAFTRTAFTHNESGLNASGAGTVILNECTVSANPGFGVLFQATAPAVVTRGNNTIEFNGTDVSGGTLGFYSGK